MTSAPTARDQASDDEETKVRWDLESIRRCLTPGASFIPTVELTPQRTAPLVCLGEQFLVCVLIVNTTKQTNWLNNAFAIMYC